jgi:hypothetical protein
MSLSELNSKKILLDKLKKSLDEIGENFLGPVEAILNRKDINEKAKMLEIENYFNKNFNKFKGIEEVRNFYNIRVKDYTKGL